MIISFYWDNFHSQLTPQFEAWLGKNWHLVLSYNPNFAPHAGEDSVLRIIRLSDKFNPTVEDTFTNGGDIIFED